MKTWFVVAGIWALGMVTLVPYGTWTLLFHAPKEDYTFWIGLVIGWVFFYFPIVTPGIMAWRWLRIMRRAEQYDSFPAMVRDAQMTREDVLDIVAHDVGLPRFLVRILVRKWLDAMLKRMESSQKEKEPSVE